MKNKFFTWLDKYPAEELIAWIFCILMFWTPIANMLTLADTFINYLGAFIIILFVYILVIRLKHIYDNNNKDIF